MNVSSGTGSPQSRKTVVCVCVCVLRRSRISWSFQASMSMGTCLLILAGVEPSRRWREFGPDSSDLSVFHQMILKF